MKNTALLIGSVVLIVTGCSTVNMGTSALNRGDCAAATKHWIWRAKSGDPAAQNNMGLIWERGCPSWGDGIPQDYTEAYNWFILAASNGQPVAMRNLGVYHESGLGVDQDIEKAASWYALAARHGDSGARARLVAIGRSVPAPDLIAQRGDGSSWVSAFAAAFLLAAASDYDRPSTSFVSGEINVTTKCRTRTQGAYVYTDCR